MQQALGVAVQLAARSKLYAYRCKTENSVSFKCARTYKIQIKLDMQRYISRALAIADLLATLLQLLRRHYSVPLP